MALLVSIHGTKSHMSVHDTEPRVSTEHLWMGLNGNLLFQLHQKKVYGLREKVTECIYTNMC